MSFADDVKRFTVLVTGRVEGVGAAVAADIHASIVDGSPVTGAPGQPVDTGNLKASWILRPVPQGWEVSTNVAYAPGIEDGISQRWGTPMQVRSHTGGFHSAKTTIAAADILQRLAVARLTGAM